MSPRGYFYSGMRLVIRDVYIFRRLTGSQRTLGKWGVTKIWLNSLRPRTIRNWTEMHAEFMKKFFSTHKTNTLKRQIYTFAAYDNEKFYQCWERYLETIYHCPHHGFDTWMLVNHFYDGMSPAMKQLLETMC